MIDKYLNKITCGDNCVLIKELPDECIDLTVTSPPYDNLREYNGYSFDFETLAKELYRVTKQGGVIVWIVSDATVDGSETGTSFRQALFFKDLGFNLHDTMIWEKPSFTATGSLSVRYASVFEYMFILSKGKPKAFNPIKDRLNKYGGGNLHGTIREKNGETRKITGGGEKQISTYGQRFNVWHIPPENVERNGHPAPFPETLCKDHIISWSNEGDIVLDPFMGSGTTALCARLLGRRYIGFEISQEYVDIANKRNSQISIFDI